MKSALFASVILVLFSFGTTALVYDFSLNREPVQKSTPIVRTNMNSPLTTSSTTTIINSTSTISGSSTIELSIAMSTSTDTTKKTAEIASTKPRNSTIQITDEVKKPPTVVTTTTTTSPVKVSTQAPILKPAPVPTTTKKPISWGVFTGSNPTVIHDFETKVEANPDYLAYFIHWGNGAGALPTYLKDYAYKKDRTLVIFWEASDYKIGGTDQPAFSYSTMLRGDWDEYFESFADQLKKYEGPIILIPFSELNGNWTPWSGTKNGNTPELAVEAFRYVHGFFADLPNVKIGWAVNSASVPNTPENQIANYYPGDEYVDIVGVDGFNMNWPWLTFDEIFGKPLQIISQYNKPMFIFSFASAEGPDKAEWLNDALNIQMPKYPLLQGWIYFNQNKERNWLLWSDNETFSVFTDYISR